MSRRKESIASHTPESLVTAALQVATITLNGALRQAAHLGVQAQVTVQGAPEEPGAVSRQEVTIDLARRT